MPTRYVGIFCPDTRFVLTDLQVFPTIVNRDSSSGPIVPGILARDNPLSQVERERDQRPRLPEPEHDENNKVCLVSSLPDEVAEENHEHQSADGGIDVRRGLMFPNQAYHHHC